VRKISLEDYKSCTQIITIIAQQFIDRRRELKLLEEKYKEDKYS